MVWHIVVMQHCVRLLTTAFCTDEYLVLQVKHTVGLLNLLEQQLTTAVVAMRRGRRLAEGAHGISFRPTSFEAGERDAQKGPD
jgi:hypothetical protein